jgi:hypothetical protein
MAMTGQGAGGSNVRTLLGSAGINLQQQRAAEARADTSSAQSLQQQRQNILGNLATLDNNIRGAKMQRAAGAAQLGSSSIPNIGLSGADVTNMDVSNVNLANQKTMALAGLSAQKDVAKGQMVSSIISQGTGLGSQLLGGMGGGGMSMSGVGSWIGGLLQGSGNKANNVNNDPGWGGGAGSGGY